MPRLPYAAKTLQRQVAERLGDPSMTAHRADADGLGVYRTLVFTGGAGDYLASVSEALTFDKRIRNAELQEDGFVVEFVHTILADDKADFLLREVEAITDPSSEEDYLIELRATPVADLREMYPQYAELTKKDLIDAVMNGSV